MHEQLLKTGSSIVVVYTLRARKDFLATGYDVTVAYMLWEHAVPVQIWVPRKKILAGEGA